MHFDNIINVRELGGLVLPDGSRVKNGLLLRGGALDKASDRDIETLKDEYRTAYVFDFRTQGEVKRAPDREVPGARNVWLPAIDPETEKLADAALPKEAFMDLEKFLLANAKDRRVQIIASRLYTDMVSNEYTQLQYAAFMQLAASSEGRAIYWHCSQGKDRTGLAAAFLLSALGADRDLIVKEYELSNETYREDVERINRKIVEAGGGEAEMAVVQTFIGVNVNYFNDALDLIDREYGSMKDYVRNQLCMADPDIESLKRNYLTF